MNKPTDEEEYYFTVLWELEHIDQDFRAWSAIKEEFYKDAQGFAAWYKGMKDYYKEQLEELRNES